MNEEIDESEFYHQDFTTASEWEVFIARMEEIIHGWRLENNKENKEVNKENLRIKTEQLPFADVDFTLTLYENLNNIHEIVEEDDQKPSKNPIDTDYDFVLTDGTNTNSEHSLAFWYGLNKFIVLAPINNAAIVSESRIKILLSSAHIVVGNLNCEIPIFVQIREKWQRCFLGVYEGEGIRTNFEMVHLRKGPQHCQYLTGLLDLFKTKILSPVSLDPIIVSVKFTYHLNDFGNYVWKQDLHDNDLDNLDSTNLCSLPFGVTFDPVKTLVLRTFWSHLADHMIVDSENYSDFDPMQAPKWSVSINFNDEPICLLTDCLNEFLHLLKNNSTVYDVLGDYANPPVHDAPNPLDLLTEHKVPTISSVLKRAARNSLTRNRTGIAPLSEDVLVPMLYFLFPDAEDEPQSPYFDKEAKEKDANNSVRTHKMFFNI